VVDGAGVLFPPDRVWELATAKLDRILEIGEDLRHTSVVGPDDSSNSEYSTQKPL
jgi:hypothetical protein